MKGNDGQALAGAEARWRWWKCKQLPLRGPFLITIAKHVFEKFVGEKRRVDRDDRQEDNASKSSDRQNEVEW